ncbi:ComF family protein [Campylobacter sp. RM13119]|uniref:ComF family protein n=1 Tax=Campylobacter californiensis TaxID=1032243 RepID=A0ABD4JKD1_9BACT|nr:ComF family protein [Campylobacter sp. RM13119]MBE2987226.1 ComF family protein [Campylobacter sp. RM12919]MBE2988927.1 ComF family protein [Campylobacter sp. RM12920]MBE3022985.1 ComF family protein [Campylobacter sp. 7477a]MBE3607006.1 ComF family protein [Campylobacter sp. RM13119]
MFCLNCGSFSIFTFCKICEFSLKEPTLALREVEGFKIYSFYEYSAIKNLIHSKHKFHGSFVYKALANLSFKKFAKNFTLNLKANVVAIDDHILHGYSHTAILAKAMSSKNLRPIYRVLHATSKVTYSGKSTKFRQDNPRNFKILKSPKYPVILVDDIITTATTMIEAKSTLEKAGFEVLFGLVLADARY